MHRAEGHDHHSQGLRWRLRRHEFQAPARRRQLGLADGGNRRHGAEGAVEIIFRTDIGDEEKIAERTEEYRKRFANPFVAGHRGFIDDVIMPHGTRARIAKSLRMLRDKQIENPWKKHGNIPL